jgi:catechol 2,3-dioxygenase-like lactoylglutathione lyase family enzyme
MSIHSIDHIQIAIPAGGEEAARVFYGDVLGLGEVEKPPVLAKRGGAWFEKGATKIHLGIDPDFTPAKKAHVCFIVEDLDAMAVAMTNKNFEVKPDTAIKNTKRFFTKDPFGNRIEIMEKS